VVSRDYKESLVQDPGFLVNVLDLAQVRVELAHVDDHLRWVGDPPIDMSEWPVKLRVVAQGHALMHLGQGCQCKLGSEPVILAVF